MERRKIMALGQSSRVISLPKAWLKKVNLDKGNWVSLDFERDGSLVIHPETNSREEVSKICLEVKSNESQDSIIRKIIGSYLNGYTIIKLKSKKIFTVDQREVIRQIVGTLYMMIIESEASNVVLETLIDESKVSISSCIERMHLITVSMLRDVLGSMKNWDKELSKTVVSLEDDVDQLMFVLLRLIRCAVVSPSLANTLDLGTLDCLEYQTLVHRIEWVADQAASVAKSVFALIEDEIEMPENVLSALLKSTEIAYTSYDMAFQSYLSNNVELTHEIIDNQKEIQDLYEDISPLPYFGKPNETSVLSNIITIRECITKISHHAADIAELTIDRAYKKENITS